MKIFGKGKLPENEYGELPVKTDFMNNPPYGNVVGYDDDSGWGRWKFAEETRLEDIPIKTFEFKEGNYGEVYRNTLKK